MKKNLSVLVIGLVLLLGACSKKSNNNNNNGYTGFQQPQYAPPNNSWNNHNQGYVPTGNCGSASQLPANCAGTYNGYNYCNNQWYYGFSNVYWIFPAFGSCGNTGNNGGNWWDDYDTDYDDDDDYVPPVIDDDDDGGCHDDCDDGVQEITNTTGWIKLWNNMGSSKDQFITFRPLKSGTYYISIKGNYDGKKEQSEVMTTKFSCEGVSGNTHTVKDLDQSYTGSSEVTKTCKVNVNFKLDAGKTYKLHLKGVQQDVNNTFIRVTNTWPSDVSKLCN